MVHTVIPHMVQQLLLTDRAALVQQQVFQYPKLLSGKGQLLPTGRGDAGFGVKGYLPAGEDHIVLRKLPPGKAAYPGG